MQDGSLKKRKNVLGVENLLLLLDIFKVTLLYWHHKNDTSIKIYPKSKKKTTILFKNVRVCQFEIKGQTGQRWLKNTMLP